MIESYTKPVNYGVYEFHINAEKRTVVCVLIPDDQGDVLATFIKHFNKNSSGKLRLDVINATDDMFVQPKYVGVAKCDPTDAFDTERGAKLAELRAYKQYTKDRAIRLQKIADIMQETRNRLDKVILNGINAGERVDAQIAELSK